MMLRDELILHCAPGLGPVFFYRLVEAFGSPALVVAASRSRLADAGVPARAIDFIKSPDEERLEQIRSWMEQDGCQVLSWQDSAYPPRLLELKNPPPLLFVNGRTDILCDPQLAVVGSRHATVAGLRDARAFSRHLAASGLIITSGLAEGIDGAAHQGALDAGGVTIAVMGTGPDRIYPARHRELAHQIVSSGGALVSEYAPGTTAQARFFPQRNRLISGLSLGVLVVEASQNSGSLITARYAAEQGREVFAIPGSIHSPLSKGCHDLIKQGAKLVDNAGDILQEMDQALVSAIAEKPREATGNITCEVNEDNLTQDQRALLEAMGFAPVSLDALAEATGLKIQDVASMVLILELEGHIFAMPGGYYCRQKRE